MPLTTAQLDRITDIMFNLKPEESREAIYALNGEELCQLANESRALMERLENVTEWIAEAWQRPSPQLVDPDNVSWSDLHYDDDQG